MPGPLSVKYLNTIYLKIFCMIFYNYIFIIFTYILVGFVMIIIMTI
jgi:hypothetical protein